MYTPCLETVGQMRCEQPERGRLASRRADDFGERNSAMRLRHRHGAQRGSGTSFLGPEKRGKSNAVSGNEAKRREERMCSLGLGE